MIYYQVVDFIKIIIGNIVTIWEALVEHYDKTGEKLVDLGSDQTSCHNPYGGGYFPVQV